MKEIDMDVTRDLMRYREIARMVWNAMVESATVEEMDFDRVDEFHGICKEIFHRMVCDKFDIDYKKVPYLRPTGLEVNSPVPGLFVEPHVVDADPDYELNLMPLHTAWGITPHRKGREVKSAGVISGAASLQFMGFFDFGSFQFRDFQYVMVLVQEFKARPDYEGFLALLPANTVRYVMRTEADVG